jgi:hypothetical protein
VLCSQLALSARGPVASPLHLREGLFSSCCFSVNYFSRISRSFSSSAIAANDPRLFCGGGVIAICQNRSTVFCIYLTRSLAALVLMRLPEPKKFPYRGRSCAMDAPFLSILVRKWRHDRRFLRDRNRAPRQSLPPARISSVDRTPIWGEGIAGKRR